MADNASLDLNDAIAKLQTNLEHLTKSFKQKVDQVVGQASGELETHMKINRKWTDRSTRARQGLSGKWAKGDTDYDWIITLSHSVSYGVFLELAHEKKYAIIQPTILLKGPEVMKAFNNLLEAASNVQIKL